MFPFPHGDSFLVVIGYEAEVIVGTFRVTWTVRVQVLYREGRREGFSALYSFIHSSPQLWTVHTQAFSMQEQQFKGAVGILKKLSILETTLL